MRILVTNDDGIHAPGLAACEKIARALSDDVWIVAPETDQSGVSHSLSLNDPLRLREVGDKHFAVSGTPTDCVIMGVRHIMKEPPDLVLSGVNRGRNCAEDVTYSGTVAARDGRHRPGRAIVRAVAGLCLRQQEQAVLGNRGQVRARHRCAACMKQGMPRDVLVNVNFPDCAPDEVAGIAITVQGKRDQELLRIDRAP